MNKTKRTKPSEVVKDMLDFCLETGEKQYVQNLDGGDGFIIYTRGKTTAWKHTILSEEIDFSDIPAKLEIQNENPSE